MGSLNNVQFLKEIQRSMRSEVGKALPPLLKRWRYTQSADFSALPLLEGTRRFLIRYGLLDSAKNSEELTKSFHELLHDVSRVSGEAFGIVAAWLELFAEGEYGVLKEGICSITPRCGTCPLKEGCRFLVAGATDSRSFGIHLSETLLLETTRSQGDLRSADRVSFLLYGERCGSTDITRIEASLKSCNGLRGLFLARPETLIELGFDDAARARLNALSETCRQWAEEIPAARRAFLCGRDFYDHYHLRLRDLRKEVFIVVLLDNKNRLIHEDFISEGSLTETLVHPREVFANAISRRAAAVAMVHNHPSGDPDPSPADKSMTKRLQSVADLVGIRLLDHVVIGDGSFISFMEKGFLTSRH